MSRQNHRFVKRSQVLAAAAVAALATQSVLADGDFSRNVGAAGFTWNTSGWTAVGDTGGQVYPGDGVGPFAGTETATLNFNDVAGDRTVTIGLAGGWTLDISSLTAVQALTSGTSRTLNLNATNAGTLFTNALTLNNLDGTATSNSNRLNLVLNANVAVSSRNAGADLLTITNNMQANSRQITINGAVTSTGLTLAGVGSGDSGRINLAGAVNFGSGAFTVTGSATRQVSGVLSGTGGIVHSGTGSFSLTNGGNSFSGNILVNGGGSLVLENASGSSELALGAASNTITLTNNSSIDFSGLNTAQVINLSPARTITIGTGGGKIRPVGGSNVLLTLSAGQLLGSGTLTKDFGGGLVLAGSNTGFSGNTIIGGGTSSGGGILQVNHIDALGDTSGTYGTIEIGNSTGGTGDRFVYLVNYANYNANPAKELGRITASSNGVLALAQDTANALDFTATPLLHLAAAGTTPVTVSGTITPGSNGYLFGGGTGGYGTPPPGALLPNGKLVVDTVLADNGGPTNLTTRGVGITVLNQANTYTGNTVIGGGTLLLANANSISSSAATPSAVGTLGTVASPGVVIGYDGRASGVSGDIDPITANTQAVSGLTSGGLLLDPSITYNANTYATKLDGGSIGYTGDVTLTSAPAGLATGATFSTLINGVATVNGSNQTLQPGVVGNARLLHLGGFGSTGTMTQAPSWTIADVGSDPVVVVKSGTDSTLDLSSAPVSGNTHTGGTVLAGGTVVINRGNQLGTGALVLNVDSTLKVVDDDANPLTPHTITIPVLKAKGDFFVGGTRGTIDVAAGSTVVVQQVDNSLVPRSWIRKTGSGVLDISRSDITGQVPIGTSNAANLLRFSLEVTEGTLRTNHLMFTSRTNTGGDSGGIVFGGGILDVTGALPTGMPALTDASQLYGTVGFNVLPATTSTLRIGAGQLFRNTDQANDAFHAWQGTLIVEGADETARILLRGGSSGSSVGFAGTNDANGVLDFRGGKLDFSNWGGSRIGLPVDPTFTYKFNGGLINFDNANTLGNNNLGQALQGAVVFSDAAGTTTPKLVVNTVAQSLSFTGSGNVTWGAANAVSLEKQGAATLTFNRTGGTVSVASGANLLISGGTVVIDGGIDPLSDGTNHVAVANNASFEARRATTVQSLTGTGNTTVTAAGTLNLAGNASHGQTTMTNNGTLNVNAGTAGFGTLAGTGTTNVAAGATLILQGAANAQATVNVDGTLAGTGTIAAAVNVNGPSGKVAPGTSAGTLNVTGTATINAGGTYAVELESISSFDKLLVSGAVSVNGAMTIDLLGGYEPAHTDTFTVLTSTGLTGTFSNTNAWGLIPAGTGKAMLPEYTATDVVLKEFTKVGDVDFDGLINNQDIAPFVAVLTGVAPLPPSSLGFAADVNGDGLVNNQDIAPFVALLTGGPSPVSDADLAPLMSLVPEPASLSLLALGGLALRRRRR